jgi:menaquinone-dependent protoporphyrinogen oxidase
MPKVLVAYATTYGATREIADAVAAELGAQGIETTVSCAAHVRDLGGYDAVVVGIALYMFMLHGDAKKFLRRNRKALAAIPVALFASGPTDDKPEDYATARETVDKALAKREWLKPVAVTVFGGKFDPAALRFPHNNPGVKSLPAGDIRDWDAIKAWSESLPEAFGMGMGRTGS